MFSAFLLITVLAVYFYSPIFKTNAAESDLVYVGADISPVASVAADVDELNFDFTPTPSGVFDSKSVTATASTNAVKGYELYFSSTDNYTDMESNDTSDVISSDFNNTVTSSTMLNNKWGYSLDNTDFSKIPTVANQVTLINIDHLPTSSELNKTVYIGIKVDNTIDAATYTKDIKFSVLAHDNPKNNNRLAELTSMQDSNLATYCASTYTPTKNATHASFDNEFSGDMVPRAILTDERDGNKYLISKLADGNCWMSQNLALNLSTSKALTNANTDLNTKTSWTPNNNTQEGGEGQWDATSARSFRPVASQRYYRDGYIPSDSPTASNGNYVYESAGNLYNWFAATAGSGLASLVSTTVNDSICPKGWRLPINQTGSKSFRYLLSIYNLVVDEGSTVAPEKLMSFPLNFIRAGRYFSSHNAQGNHGAYYSATADNETYAFYLAFNAGVVYPSRNIDPKYSGMSVRCVAR